MPQIPIGELADFGTRIFSAAGAPPESHAAYRSRLCNPIRMAYIHTARICSPSTSR